jgi:hypothetical protein
MARRQPANRKSSRPRKSTKPKTEARKRASKATTGASEITSERKRARQAIALIDEWLADDSGYDKENWPKLKQALDEDRRSSRRPM